MSAFNKFFDKIFVINLYDKVERWKKVQKQFCNRKIKIERFVAIDGRCMKEGKTACEDKLKTFEIMYNVKISNDQGYPLKTLVPASSLTIGTILILRYMVKHNLERILICEDDIELSRGIENKFRQGIKEIGNQEWDLLYLGCGGACGSKGVSYEKTRKNKHFSGVAEKYEEDEYFVSVKEDLRRPCEVEECIPFSEHISYAKKPGGTWAYAFSLKGAKKMLKLIKDDAGEHIDHLLGDNIKVGKVTALAFDPPIVYHEGGIERIGSDIPWE